VRLLRLDQVEARAGDRVYRHRRILAAASWLAALAGALAMLRSASAGTWKPGYIFAPFLMVFLMLTRGFVTARFRASNWLVRASDTGINVQYRSYLNFRLPPDTPSVVFIAYDEIVSARLVRERVTTPDPSGQNRTQTQFLRHVELELRGDTRPLADALEAERQQKAALLFRDQPLTLKTPPCLRIHWDVVPRAHSFLDVLRSHTTIAAPVSVTEDFAHPQRADPEQQRERIRALARRGQVVEAIYLAARVHRCSLAEAKQMVDQLMEQPD